MFLEFKLGVEGQIWGFEKHFWDLFWGLVSASGGLGGPEATGKGFARAWVGTRVAGDPGMGPIWAQLEPSWSQLGASMGPT